MSTPEKRWRRTANVAACSSVRLLSFTRSKPRWERTRSRNVFVLARIDEPERLELLQRLVETLDFLRDRDELPAREVLRDHDAVAIVDEPARRRQRLEPEAVALRELGEALVVDDLENDEPRDEQPGEEHDDDRGRDDPGQEQLLLLPVILEACRP